MTTALSDEHVGEVCGLGRGEKCCAFLAMGGENGTWACAKELPNVVGAIRARLANGTMQERGDNCAGPPTFETAGAAVSAQELRDRYPEIEWDEPVRVTVGSIGQWWVCRVCIAQYGLKASEIDVTPFAFVQERDAIKHVSSHGVAR